MIYPKGTTKPVMPPAANPKPRVFVLDDDPEMGRLVEKVLARRDYAVTTAVSPQEALEELLTGYYDLLITDLRMPGLDGLSLLRICLEAVPRMKVVVMSAYGDLEDYRAALAAGAFGYLPKPLSIGDLTQITDRALAEKRTAH